MQCISWLFELYLATVHQRLRLFKNHFKVKVLIENTNKTFQNCVRLIA